MSEKSVVVGIWCGSPSAELLAPVGLPGEEQQPVLRLTLTRLRVARYPMVVLIPWLATYDHIEEDVKDWGYHLRRCHPDERIAMRDVMASSGADIGVVIYGTAATLDIEEVNLAVARYSRGVGDRAYLSPRMKCLPAEVWLLPNDEGEWVEPMSARDLSNLYVRQSFSDKLPYAQARALRSRRETQLPDQTRLG